MNDAESIEPSAIIVPSHAGLAPVRRSDASAAGWRGTTRSLVPTVMRDLTGRELVTALTLAAAAVVAARSAAIVSRLAWPGVEPARRPARNPNSRTAPAGGDVHVSWTRVEIRWLPEG